MKRKVVPLEHSLCVQAPVILAGNCKKGVSTTTHIVPLIAVLVLQLLVWLKMDFCGSHWSLKPLEYTGACKPHFQGPEGLLICAHSLKTSECVQLLEIMRNKPISNVLFVKPMLFGHH